MRNLQKYFDLSIRHKCRLASVALIVLSLSAFVSVPSMRAVDGGLGRSISGAQITPYQAIVPPEEGVFFANVGIAYYPGAIGGAKTFPNGGKLLSDIDADLTLVPITLAYSWAGVAEKWNVLSAVVLSFADVSLEADVSIGNAPTVRSHDSNSGLYDTMFRIVQGSYHISQVQHVSLSFDLWAPTGSYDSKRLANLSLDNWTGVATFSYTQLFPEENIEFSGLWALEYYTANRETDYHSGIISRMEALVMKRFPSGIGVGVIGSWMQQLNNDTGPLADALGGFKGRAFGVGPILEWSGKSGDMPINVSARWVHEFDNKNLLQGDVFSLSIGTQF